MMFCLAGEFRVTTSSGQKRSFAAGDCLLMEDTFGKGHITEVTSDKPLTKNAGLFVVLSAIVPAGGISAADC